MIQSETRSVWLVFFLGGCCVTTVLGRDETATGTLFLTGLTQGVVLDMSDIN